MMSNDGSPGFPHFVSSNDFDVKRLESLAYREGYRPDSVDQTRSIPGGSSELNGVAGRRIHISPTCVKVEPSERLRHKRTREIVGGGPLFKYAPVRLLSPKESEDYERVCPECDGNGVYRRCDYFYDIVDFGTPDAKLLQVYRCTNCAHRVEEKA